MGNLINLYKFSNECFSNKFDLCALSIKFISSPKTISAFVDDPSNTILDSNVAALSTSIRFK